MINGVHESVWQAINENSNTDEREFMAALMTMWEKSEFVDKINIHNLATTYSGGPSIADMCELDEYFATPTKLAEVIDAGKFHIYDEYFWLEGEDLVSGSECHYGEGVFPFDNEEELERILQELFRRCGHCGVEKGLDMISKGIIN